jgi:hypothetical protein
LHTYPPLAAGMQIIPQPVHGFCASQAVPQPVGICPTALPSPPAPASEEESAAGGGTWQASRAPTATRAPPMRSATTLRAAP